MMTWICGLLLGLPFSVWLLATICAVIDEPQPLRPLLRLSIAASFVLLVLLLVGIGLLYPLLVSFAVVVVLHTGGYFLMRDFGTGVIVYERTPPRPPLLDEEVSNSGS